MVIFSKLNLLCALFGTSVGSMLGLQDRNETTPLLPPSSHQAVYAYKRIDRGFTPDAVLNLNTVMAQGQLSPVVLDACLAAVLEPRARDDAALRTNLTLIQDLIAKGASPSRNDAALFHKAFCEREPAVIKQLICCDPAVRDVQSVRDHLLSRYHFFFDNRKKTFTDQGVLEYERLKATMDANELIENRKRAGLHSARSPAFH